MSAHWELSSDAAVRVRQRLRLLAVCLGLTLAVFAQNAGRVAADTKLDLLVDPARLMHRALSLWDPNGSAGQLQDQAYGYLFPMGPFFLAGKLLGLAPWVIQRSWESALILAAFLGVVRLSRALGNENFWARVAAGLAYCLAPRMLTEIFSISSELLPVAVAPWVLLPLVIGSRGGSTRRAAAHSGMALLFAGGINASATLAILPIPALWLLTRERGPRRASLMRWWSLAVVLACAWWLIPLAVLGRYSPPFLDWIESSAVTTSQNSLLAVLRGVDHWQAYLGSTVWPAGWVLVVVPAAVFATSGVAALGLAGLGRPDVRHRLFYVSTLLVGLVLLTVGHRSGLGSPFSATVQRLLDGPLNTFRNIHKFDPLVRLPLAVGLGFLLARVRLPVSRAWLDRAGVPAAYAQRLAVVTVLALGAVAVGPVFNGHMVPQARTTVDPAWWSDAGRWLANNSDGGRALVLPGAGRPNMLWGQTVDDPLQPEATSPWTVRDALPLAQPGYIRLLDSVDQIFARGERSPTVAEVLARAGVKFVVVRNDLESGSANATRLGYVHATIDNSPGFTKRAGFGPDFGASQYVGQLSDAGLGRDHPAVEIYAVSGYPGVVSVLPAQRVLRATGSADSLPQLVERGIDAQTPVVFDDGTGRGSGAGSPAAATIADDGIRRREVPFGVPGVVAQTMTEGQPFTAARAVHDYLPAGAGALSAFRYTGITNIAASSAGSDLTAPVNRGAANGPFAAVDDSATSAWLSSGFSGAVGQWLQVELPAPVDPVGTQVSFAAGLGDYPSRIRVETDAGTLDSDVASDDNVQPLVTPAGSTRHLRVTILAMASGSRGVSVGISSLAIPGVRAARTLDVPLTGTPTVLAFDVAAGYRNECLSIDGSASCDPVNASAGEEDTALDRTFTLAAPQTYHVAATVRMTPSNSLSAKLDETRSTRARASSQQNANPMVRAGAAVDGDPATTWTASATDEHPALTLTLDQPRTVRGIRIRTAATAPVSRARDVVVIAGNQTWTGAVPKDGVIRLDSPVRTDTVTIGITDVTRRYTTDSRTGYSRLLPTGISEATVLGAGAETARAKNIVFGCDAGISLEVDGRVLPLHTAPMIAEAQQGLPTLAVPCGDDTLALGAGEHRIRLTGGGVALADSLTATAAPGLALAPTAVQEPTVARWGATDRSVRVDAGPDSVLVIRENANRGWRASLGGKRLTAVTVDGWQQGFLLPRHAAGVVQLRFAPQRAYVAGLVVGAAGVVLLALLAMVRPRRDEEAAPCEDATPGPGWAEGALLVVGFVLLGVAGAVLAGAVLLVRGRLVRRVPGWVAAAGVLALVGILAAFYPPGSAHAVSDRWFVQLLCWLSVLLAAVSVCTWRLRPGASLSRRRSMPNQDTAATAVAATPVTRNSTQK